MRDIHTKRPLPILSLLVMGLFVTAPVNAELRNGMDADVVLGQPDFRSNSSGTTQTTFTNPFSLHSDGTRLYVADYSNHRILIWNAIPTSNYVAPDIVVGQPDFVTVSAGTTQSKLNYPAVHSDGKRLIVAEYDNRRVLIWNTIPTTNGAPADVVVGQPDFVTSSAGVTDSKIHSTQYAMSDGTRLVVADTENRRVLIWNTIPTVNSTPADVVVGQPDFTTNSIGLTASKIRRSGGAYSDGTHLLVYDQTATGAGRILIWNKIPTTNGVPADVVLGQPDFTSSTLQPVSSRSFSGLIMVHVGGDKILLGDVSKNRVLIWNSIPTENYAPADFVLGQPDFTTSTSGVGKNKTNVPYGAAFDGKRFFIADFSNHRVLIFGLTAAGPADLGPQFTQGKGVLGKVFWDLNEDGNQDEGEKGVEGVRVASDTGIYAITDEDGKYHYPYIETGQRLLKIDPSTLPEGVNFTTDNPRKVTVTEGILTKVSFGLKPLGVSGSENASGVSGPEGVSESGPLLKVSASQDPLNLSKTLSVTHAWTDDTTLDFKITCNYRLFIASAKLLLYDKNHEVLKTIALPNPFPYQFSLNLVRESLDPQAFRSYQLKVYDKEGNEDVTDLTFTA